ncbi:MoaC family-domain-containing protein [Phyllosticta capitalensis]|uniref:MoaC family-domain-containing protein n=1 Tax=Phyllosticta capitalensis TaxID=121624 RepID=UPI00312E40F5
MQYAVKRWKSAKEVLDLLDDQAAKGDVAAQGALITKRNNAREMWHAKKQIRANLRFLTSDECRFELARLRMKHTFPKIVQQLTYIELTDTFRLNVDFSEIPIYGNQDDGEEPYPVPDGRKGRPNWHWRTFDEREELKRKWGPESQHIWDSNTEQLVKKDNPPDQGNKFEGDRFEEAIKNLRSKREEVLNQRAAERNNKLGSEQKQDSRHTILRKPKKWWGRKSSRSFRHFHTISSARQQFKSDEMPSPSQRNISSGDHNNEEDLLRPVQPEQQSTWTGGLTHVNAAGEAHMVNISAKADTRRVAFAVSTVRFSHPAVADLIRRNRMKKGDVLSTARIAGIMAAKQTPNLVPLCHNIVLTGAEVEVQLVLPPAESEVESKAEEQRAVETADKTESDSQEASATQNSSTDDVPETAAIDSKGQNSPVANGSSAELENPVSKSAVGPRHNARAAPDHGDFPNGAVFLTARCESTTATGVEMEALVAANSAALTVYDMCKAVDKHMVLGNSRVVLKSGGKSGTWVEAGWLLRRAGFQLSEHHDQTLTVSVGQDIALRENLVAKRKNWKIAFRTLRDAGFDPDHAMHLLRWMRNPIFKYLKNSSPRVKKHIEKLLLKEGISIDDLDMDEAKLMSEVGEDVEAVTTQDTVTTAPSQAEAQAQEKATATSITEKQSEEDDVESADPIADSVEQIDDLGSLIAHLRRSYMRPRPSRTDKEAGDVDMRPFEKTLRISNGKESTNSDEDAQAYGFKTSDAEMMTHVQYSVRSRNGNANGNGNGKGKRNGKPTTEDDGAQQQSPQAKDTMSSKNQKKSQREQTNSEDPNSPSEEQPEPETVSSNAKIINRLTKTQLKELLQEQLRGDISNAKNINRLTKKQLRELLQEQGRGDKVTSDKKRMAMRRHLIDEPKKMKGRTWAEAFEEQGQVVEEGKMEEEKARALGVSVESVRETEKALGLKGKDWLKR